MNDVIITQKDIDYFHRNGFLVVKDLVKPEAIEEYKRIYNDFLEGRINVGNHRSDLTGEQKEKKKESITQIMVPSRHLPSLLSSAYYTKILSIARQLLGEDLEVDFDMLINKSPFSNSPTPWHQDCAYWIDMPDKRAVSAWMPLDEATLENGCMWYVPASHLQPMRKHTSTRKNGALSCEGREKEATYVELKPGSVVLHHGGTVHYSRGNTTASHRRAMIINLRPAKMILFERESGFDHTGKRKVRKSKL